MTASSTCWTRRLDANAARIVGAAVLSFFSETTVITELTPMERAMRFFWFSTSFGEDIMAQCRMEHVFRFREPQVAMAMTLGGVFKNSLFKNLSIYSVDRLLTELVVDG